ncbi:MAG: hypothetical protein ACP5N7_01735 [Candidatus Pacearchaeota archaeon]
MATKITTIYDAIHTWIATLFPTKYELSDPSNIENNDFVSLENGYGISFNSATNTTRMLGCQYTLMRDITITLTTKFIGGHKSISISDTTTKSLLEDLHLLIKDWDKNEVILGAISNRKFLGDNGIERVFGDNKTFIMIKANFQIEYTEDLN